MQAQREVRVLAESSIDLHSTPFPHFVSSNFIDEQTAAAALAGLEQTREWILSPDDGFSHFLELSLKRTPVRALAPLMHPEFVDAVRAVCTEQFGLSFDEDVRLAVHRMDGGSRVRVHTDHGVEPFTHRVVLHLNRGWDAEHGGMLLLLEASRREELDDVHRYYLPVHRLAIGFEISPRSYHAVSEVLQGSRYTICYSLRAVPGDQSGRTV